MRKLLVLFAWCLVLAGCTTGAVLVRKPGTAPPMEPITIKTDSQNDHTFFAGLDQRVYITKVDGEASIAGCPLFVNCPQEVLVAAGRHYLDLRYQHLNNFATGRVWFDAERGKSYIVRRRVIGYGVRLWVEEADTGRTVGGIPGSEPEKQ